MLRPPPRPTLFPYTTLFRSKPRSPKRCTSGHHPLHYGVARTIAADLDAQRIAPRSEEHTSELQSRGHLVCRLLLEKKKQIVLVTSDLKVSRSIATSLRNRSH